MANLKTDRNTTERSWGQKKKLDFDEEEEDREKAEESGVEGLGEREEYEEHDSEPYRPELEPDFGRQYEEMQEGQQNLGDYKEDEEYASEIQEINKIE